MKDSDAVTKLIDEVNDFSGKIIKNRYEVSVIMKITNTPGRDQEFKDLIFTAKYVNGLKGILSNKDLTGDRYIEKIFDEFNKNLEKFISSLKAIIIQSDETINKHFTDKYFLLNQVSIANGMELIEDLSLCKEYFNNKQMPHTK